jgi:formate dehydrogenase subunit delta
MLHGADRLVLMANQISRAYAIEGETRAVMQTASHIQKFWEPRMRDAITAYVKETGGKGLDEFALKAIGELKPSRINPALGA